MLPNLASNLLRTMLFNSNLLAFFMLYFLLMTSSKSLASVEIMTPTLSSYEAAYLSAATIVEGDISPYSNENGATFHVKMVLRGEALTLTHYQLQDTTNYSFLTELQKQVTVFVSVVEQDRLILWQAPTSGGLIWSEPNLIKKLTKAALSPNNSLEATDPRERLAAAYFMTVNIHNKNKTPQNNQQAIIEAVIWGLAQDSANTNQTALDILNAIGIKPSNILKNYHPFHRLELKARAAEQFSDWWKNKK